MDTSQPERSNEKKETKRVKHFDNILRSPSEYRYSPKAKHWLSYSKGIKRSKAIKATDTLIEKEIEEKGNLKEEEKINETKPGSSKIKNDTKALLLDSTDDFDAISVSSASAEDIPLTNYNAPKKDDFAVLRCPGK